MTMPDIETSGQMRIEVLTPERAERLSRAFNVSADLRQTEDFIINEWLKRFIELAKASKNRPMEKP